jgi:hypothetical protein
MLQENDKMVKSKLYYYSEAEWDRLGCGPLPQERDITKIDELEEYRQQATDLWFKDGSCTGGKPE